LAYTVLLYDKARCKRKFKMTTFCLVTDAKTSDSAVQGSKYINCSLVFVFVSYFNGGKKLMKSETQLRNVFRHFFALFV